MKYTKVNKYKYRVYETEIFDTPIKGYCVDNPFFSLDVDGRLQVYSGYMWDGASGPTIDCKASIYASTPHDVFYQCMRSGLIDQKEKDKVDLYLRHLLIEHGMDRFRAGYYYYGVKYFSGNNAKYNPERDKVVVLYA